MKAPSIHHRPPHSSINRSKQFKEMLWSVFLSSVGENESIPVRAQRYLELASVPESGCSLVSKCFCLLNTFEKSGCGVIFSVKNLSNEHFQPSFTDWWSWLESLRSIYNVIMWLFISSLLVFLSAGSLYCSNSHPLPFPTSPLGSLFTARSIPALLWPSFL